MCPLDLWTSIPMAAEDMILWMARRRIILGAAELYARYGTTSMVPTTLTCPNEELKNLMTAFHAAKQSNKQGQNYSGLHLEGPPLPKIRPGARCPLHSGNRTGRSIWRF